MMRRSAEAERIQMRGFQPARLETDRVSKEPIRRRNFRRLTRGVLLHGASSAQLAVA